MVARVCTRLGVPHRIIRLDLAKRSGLQARARSARYAALAEWLAARDLSALATGHHADDQAELLVMRLNRGAGVHGLAGMRTCAALPGATGYPLIRPLLGWRRSELSAIVVAAGLEAADDPSNADARFERARIRRAIAGADWLDAAALARSAEYLAQADTALDWAADREWQRIREGTPLCWAPEAPRAIRLRVLARIVATLGRSEPRGLALARWLDALEAGRVATLAGVRGDGRRVPWRFSCAAAHRD